MECIFCKIIKNEIPNHLVYEDDYVKAFLDIAPVQPGHVLVVSKQHVENLGQVDEVVLGHLIKAVQTIGESLKKSLGAKGYNIIVNDGAAAGQLIDHFHFHLIPRHKAEELQSWPQGQYQASEIEAMAKKIKAGLA